MTVEPTSLVPAAVPTSSIADAARHLTPDEWQQARVIAAGLDVRDALAVTGFGIKPQKEMSALADPILKMVQTKDAGAAGEALSELMLQVRDVDPDGLAGLVEPALARLPGIGSMFSKVERFRARYERIGDKIDRIVVELERRKLALSRDVALLDKYYEQNRTYIRGLLVHIVAGETLLDELRSEQGRLAESAMASGDPLDAQAAADLGNHSARLERRVHDLKLATMVALQAAPQMRLVQNGNQMLIEKIQSSLVMTIPLWKQQIIQALVMMNQVKALARQKGVTDLTNRMIEENARNLRESARRVAQEAERGIVDIETLARSNQHLIGTIQDVLEVQKVGSEARKKAEDRLSQLEQELRSTLVRARDTQATLSDPREQEQ
jgi:uncharacterized protein YaaN involved in tellurite resistance